MAGYALPLCASTIPGEGLIDPEAPPGVACHVLDEGDPGAGGLITTHYRVVPSPPALSPV
ncbi:hypothetical protein [Streptomyces sp. NPDC048411]|uniref:hypothetical protein n=1 Tax=Streptomyces sp. NPDC048411 TaxID=3157206 RepID=UPI00345417FE